MTNKNTNEFTFTLNERSYHILEIGAEYMKISKKEFLEQIIDCMEIDTVTNQIKLNQEKLKEFKFDYHIINILRQFLIKCYEKNGSTEPIM